MSLEEFFRAVVRGSRTRREGVSGSFSFLFLETVVPDTATLWYLLAGIGGGLSTSCLVGSLFAWTDDAFDEEQIGSLMKKDY